MPTEDQNSALSISSKKQVDLVDPLPPPPILRDSSSSPDIPIPAFQLFYPAQADLPYSESTLEDPYLEQESHPSSSEDHYIHPQVTQRSTSIQEADEDVIPFIKTLWTVVNDPSLDSISWNGEDVFIDDVDEFISQCTPNHFPQVKFKAWVSELNV
jgi:hypothetical protein